MSSNAIFEVYHEKIQNIEQFKPIKEEISMMGESQMSKAITAMTELGQELSMSDGDRMDSDAEDQFQMESDSDSSDDIGRGVVTKI